MVSGIKVLLLIPLIHLRAGENFLFWEKNIVLLKLIGKQSIHCFYRFFIGGCVDFSNQIDQLNLIYCFVYSLSVKNNT